MPPVATNNALVAYAGALAMFTLVDFGINNTNNNVIVAGLGVVVAGGV
jgi:hypothetical protein